MSCFFPKDVFVNRKGFAKNSIAVTVPCRKCVGCYLDYTNEWSLRCSLELKTCETSSFITLTYSDAFLPEGGQLKRSDVQGFLKRLRRKIEPCKIRFFGCGEYGSKGLRPHYHLIIFGYQFPDLIKLKVTKKGEIIYRSLLLEKLWKFGFSSVGYVSLNSIRYCTKYLQKMVFDFDTFKVKPFTMCSTRIPIGYGALSSEQILSDELYLNGKKYKLPRSFIRRLEKNPLFPIEDIKDRREKHRIFFEKYLKSDPVTNKFFYENLLKSIDFYSNL